MFKQKPFLFSFLILSLLVIFHSTASYYSWYWRFSWFDIFTHLLSGLWIGLIMLWLASVFGQINSLKDYKVKSLLIVLVSTLLFGVLWEVLEVYGQVTFPDLPGYGLDTAGDIICGALGGILAYLYFVKRNKSQNKAEDVLHPFYSKTGIIKK